MERNTVCCKKCNLTDGCRHFVDMVNAEDSLCLLDETFETLFAWYDTQPPTWRKKSGKKMWDEVRRQWKFLIKS